MPGALNIMIVDDDEGDRMQVKRALKQAGLACECTEAANVEEALEACGKCDFDVAVVDYRMPGHDGLYGIVTLHERQPHMSIIMATGQGDEVVATEAMRLGATDYIPKIHIGPGPMRRIMERALEKADLRRKMAQRQEEQERFALVLVHDLKAPLHLIKRFIDLIEEDLRAGGARKDASISHCQRAVKVAQQLQALIDTLYAYTKVDARVTFDVVDMTPVVKCVLGNLQDLIRERGARVTHSELPAVTGNAPQLIQLLQNLIANGIKYCEAATPTIHVSANSGQDNTWTFVVKDNGIGIPEEHCQRIFEPFKRLHDQRKYDGSGLGLATCKKIVERHGGKIWCQSEEGAGTSFFFTIPVSPAVVLATAAPNSECVAVEQ
jgi:signal transduction histidine kinase